ncbi:hypothetical protein C8R44DRAFT_813382 [Mycena epipterygia]|nr:hypothetical protein C8R44DRAFT_813382 [Mycena epipterygia]
MRSELTHLFPFRSFQGILSVQAYIYYENFPEDPLSLKATLDFVHLVLISQAMYYYLVTNWGIVWRFSNRNKLLTGVLTAGCTSTLVLDLLLAAQTIASRNSTTIAPSSKRESIAVFSTGGANDLAIALVLCWYLQRRKSEFDRTKFVLTRIIHLTVSTGLLTSLLALGTLAAVRPEIPQFIYLYLLTIRVLVPRIAGHLHLARESSPNFRARALLKYAV